MVWDRSTTVRERAVSVANTGSMDSVLDENESHPAIVRHGAEESGERFEVAS
jgi:hypothetical protein